MVHFGPYLGGPYTRYRYPVVHRPAYKALAMPPGYLGPFCVHKYMVLDVLNHVYYGAV